MYTITAMRDATYLCEVRIQDGTERWICHSLENAVYKVIQAARTLNGSYIRKDDITFREENPPAPTVFSQGEVTLLLDIKLGNKVALECDDPRIVYRITKEECELIQKIREGEVTVMGKVQTEDVLKDFSKIVEVYNEMKVRKERVMKIPKDTEQEQEQGSKLEGKQKYWSATVEEMNNGTIVNMDCDVCNKYRVCLWIKDPAGTVERWMCKECYTKREDEF